jgi:hypothetical protein
MGNVKFNIRQGLVALVTTLVMGTWMFFSEVNSLAIAGYIVLWPLIWGLLTGNVKFLK